MLPYTLMNQANRINSEVSSINIIQGLEQPSHSAWYHFIIFLTTVFILQSKAVKAQSEHAAGEVPERA